MSSTTASSAKRIATGARNRLRKYLRRIPGVGNVVAPLGYLPGGWLA